MLQHVVFKELLSLISNATRLSPVEIFSRFSGENFVYYKLLQTEFPAIGARMSVIDINGRPQEMEISDYMLSLSESEYTECISSGSTGDTLDRIVIAWAKQRHPYITVLTTPDLPRAAEQRQQCFRIIDEETGEDSGWRPNILPPREI